MSKQGIELAASVFTNMQWARHGLLAMATEKKTNTKSAKQDILLSRLFERANDLIKDDFMKIVDGKYPEFLQDIT